MYYNHHGGPDTVKALCRDIRAIFCVTFDTTTPTRLKSHLVQGEPLAALILYKGTSQQSCLSQIALPALHL